MKKNTRNFIVFTAGLVFMAGALIAFNIYNKGPVNIHTARFVDVDPVTLYTSYLADSAGAHKNYDGKIVRLTGEVAGITSNTQHQQVILIKTSAAGGNINCTMEQANAPVLPGSTVTVKGICSGIGQGDADLGIAGDVYLTRTIISN